MQDGEPSACRRLPGGLRRNQNTRPRFDNNCHLVRCALAERSQDFPLSGLQASCGGSVAMMVAMRVQRRMHEQMRQVVIDGFVESTRRTLKHRDAHDNVSVHGRPDGVPESQHIRCVILAAVVAIQLPPLGGADKAQCQL